MPSKSTLTSMSGGHELLTPVGVVITWFFAHSYADITIVGGHVSVVIDPFANVYYLAFDFIFQKYQPPLLGSVFILFFFVIFGFRKVFVIQGQYPA